MSYFFISRLYQDIVVHMKRCQAIESSVEEEQAPLMRSSDLEDGKNYLVAVCALLLLLLT